MLTMAAIPMSANSQVNTYNTHVLFRPLADPSAGIGRAEGSRPGTVKLCNR